MHKERGTLLRCVLQRALCAWVSVWCLFCSRMGTFACLLLQVINIINAAQESSPVTVAEALERVLEILRTTELYSPQLASKEDDPHTNDLVGGLMNVRGNVEICFWVHSWALYKEKFFCSSHCKNAFTSRIKNWMWVLVDQRTLLASNSYQWCQQSFNRVFVYFLFFALLNKTNYEVNHCTQMFVFLKTELIVTFHIHQFFISFHRRIFVYIF